jgi:rubrerythrin
MFDLFNKKYHNPELLETIRQTQDRWFDFLDKLETRMHEMCVAAVPEIREVFNQDTDPYKRAHGRMLMGLNGQINQMRHKANKAREENIIYFIDCATAELPDFISSAGREYHDKLNAFRIACINRHNIFEEKIAHYTSLLKNAAGEQDMETTYQKQLIAFENIRDKFVCKQCGGNITISRIFFIATYITCPFCQTQNTFIPSTGAQMVLHQARSLAEQRTAHLLRIYEESKPKNSQLYQQYLRSMFNEWNKIVPDMAEENEKFYQRLLQDHLNSINHY